MEQAQSEREIIDLEHAYWRAIQEQDVDAAANLAVKDLRRARKLYEETLGLKPVHEEGE